MLKISYRRKQYNTKWCNIYQTWGEEILFYNCSNILTLSNPIFLPPAYSPALVYFGRERGWWITCNYPTVLKEKNRNRKSTTCAICWLKSVLHEEKRRKQENHNIRHHDCPSLIIEIFGSHKKDDST
jgi:hypothetical protein